MWLVTEGPGVSLAHVYQSLRRCPNVKPFALLEPGLWGLVSTFPCERRRASETAPPSPGPPGALAPSLLGAPSSLLSTPPFRGCRPLGGGRCVHRLRVLLSLAHVCLQARWLLCVLQCPLPESAVNRKARPSHPRRPRKSFKQTVQSWPVGCCLQILVLHTCPAGPLLILILFLCLCAAPPRRHAGSREKTQDYCLPQTPAEEPDAGQGQGVLGAGTRGPRG
eukprot:XP_028339869.1 uncharacterized protein LOC114484878 isoform X2 [Physeter catodon]